MVLLGAVTTCGTVSWIVKVLLKDVPVFPHASVAVQWAVITRVAPHPGTLLSSTYTGLAAPLHVSNALAPPCHAVNAAPFPAPSHSTMVLLGAVTTGGVVSLTRIVCV